MASGPSSRMRTVTGGAALARRRDRAVAEARQVDAPAELAKARRRPSRRALGAPGQGRPRSQSNQAVDRHALAERLARQRVEVGEAPRLAAALSSTTSRGRPARLRRACCRAASTGRACRRCGVAAQLERRRDVRAALVADGVDAQREPAGEASLAPVGGAGGTVVQRGREQRDGEADADAAASERPPARGIAPRRFTGRRAGAPAFRAARRSARRASAPRARRAAPRRAGRRSTALRPGGRRSRGRAAPGRRCAAGAAPPRGCPGGTRPSPGCR